MNILHSTAFYNNPCTSEYLFPACYGQSSRNITTSNELTWFSMLFFGDNIKLFSRACESYTTNHITWLWNKIAWEKQREYNYFLLSIKQVKQICTVKWVEVLRLV